MFVVYIPFFPSKLFNEVCSNFRGFISHTILPRVDVAANTATKTIHHPQLPPLGIAIMLGRMDMWKMLQEHIDLTDDAKTEQLFYMMSETEEGGNFPLEEFKELLASLPVDKVD